MHFAQLGGQPWQDVLLGESHAFRVRSLLRDVWAFPFEVKIVNSQRADLVRAATGLRARIAERAPDWMQKNNAA